MPVLMWSRKSFPFFSHTENYRWRDLICQFSCKTDSVSTSAFLLNCWNVWNKWSFLGVFRLWHAHLIALYNYLKVDCSEEGVKPFFSNDLFWQLVECQEMSQIVPEEVLIEHWEELLHGEDDWALAHITQGNSHPWSCFYGHGTKGHELVTGLGRSD